MAPPKPRSGAIKAACAGMLAVLAGLSFGHLTAGLLAPSASPALAVGSRLIDLAPTPVKEWAVSTLGTNDKPVLIVGVIAVTLALGALAGVMAQRHAWATLAFPLGLSAVAGVAALTAPGAQASWALPSVVCAVGGIVVLRWLTPRPHTATDGQARALPRRALLTGGAVVGLASAAAVVGGQWLASTSRASSRVALPAPRRALPTLPPGLTVDDVSPWVTPNADFYRVDVNLLVPNVDVATWRLSIDGMVDRPLTLTWDDLVAMELIERDVTLNCVSNEVGGPYIGSARWLGVRTRDLLARAGVRAEADQVLSRSSDGFTVSTPVQALMDDRDALVAIGMNGTLLPAEHGFPARLITPGLYGYVGATKWLTQMTLTTFAQQESYWTQRGWSENGPVKPSSRIDTPRPFGRPQPGTVMVAGVAWAQNIGVAGVQVRVDGGAWQDAELGPDAGIEYWRQWTYRWRATSGQHILESRVIDARGNAQIEARETPFPNGSTGLHSVAVTVAT